MKTIFIKWWNSGNNVIYAHNYKKAWKETGLKPRLSYSTNGARKGIDSCLDITLIIGYIVICYSNYNYAKWNETH